MKVGYARTSTIDQIAGFEFQLQQLKANGCEKVFCEQESSVKNRPQLQAALDFVREGDIFVITKIDRLARSVPHLLELIHILEQKKVGMLILNLGIDTHTPTGKLMITVLGAIAEFEREHMLERQREGVAKAKLEGRYKGRKPISNEKKQDVYRLLASGLGKAQIAKQLNIGEATVYRIIKEFKEAF